MSLSSFLNKHKRYIMSSLDLFKINSFILQFKDQTSLELMVQGCNLPGFTLGQLEIPRTVVKDVRPGDSLTYNDLNVTVICDEDLKAFKDIYRYLVLAANPNTGDLEINDTVFNASLLLTTNKNNIKHKLYFHNCFFKEISDLDLQSTTSDEEQVTFTLTCGYSFYDFEDV